MRDRIRRWLWRQLFGPFLAAELARLEAKAFEGFGEALRGGYGTECDCPEVDSKLRSHVEHTTVKMTHHRDGCPVLESAWQRESVN